MRASDTVLVVGLGEVGQPILELASEHHDVVGVDIEPKGCAGNIAVMHICYPFQIGDFVGESLRYIEFYRPQLTIIDSTVPIGTTRIVAQQSGASVAHSPVRGKHAHMLEDLRRYVKFVSAIDPEVATQAAQHFDSLGLRTKILSSPETTELAKLCETTYFGLLIAWAQEIERACDTVNAAYDEVISIFEEIGYLPPVKYFPGVIGGHCVIPNIELLRRTVESDLAEAILSSNIKKLARENRTAWVL